MLQGEADELRTALEQAERARKNAENELYEASDRVNELSSEVSSLQGQKRKLEADIQACCMIHEPPHVGVVHPQSVIAFPVNR
jgi:predicted  nucleic acid-binding Zn-ribbon protein